MSLWWIILILLALGIIAVLTVIAVRLQHQVRQVERKQQQRLAEQEALQANHQQYLHNSIQVLAQGLLDQQLTMTEGAIRISVLMDNLPERDSYRREYSAMFQLADATAHIPILDAWKKLPKKEKRRYDRERQKLEADYREFILDAAQRLRSEFN